MRSRKYRLYFESNHSLGHQYDVQVILLPSPDSLFWGKGEHTLWRQISNIVILYFCEAVCCSNMNTSSLHHSSSIPHVPLPSLKKTDNLSSVNRHTGVGLV